MGIFTEAILTGMDNAKRYNELVEIRRFGREELDEATMREIRMLIASMHEYKVSWRKT